MQTYVRRGWLTVSNPGHPRTEMHGPVRDPLDGACYMDIRGVLYVTHDLSHWVPVPTEIERRHARKLLGITPLTCDTAASDSHPSPADTGCI